MSKRWFVSCALLVVLLVSSLSAASAATPASDQQPQAGINLICRVVIAEDMRIFSGANSSNVIGYLFRNDRFYADSISNDRYHMYSPRTGWVSANFRWTIPC